MTRPKFLVMALFTLLISLGVNAQQIQLQEAPPPCLQLLISPYGPLSSSR